MKTWIAANWKQVAIVVLSAVDAILILKHPEWRIYETIIGGALGTVGIMLPGLGSQTKEVAK